MNTDLIPNIHSNNTNSQTPMWALMALSPELGELSIPLGISTSIGRQQDNDIVLASQQISRQHAKFNQIGSKLFVQDLGSSNGTFVNGQRIATQAVELTKNDEVSFADIIFVVTNEAVLDDNFTINEIAIQQNPQPEHVETPPSLMDETVTAVVPLPATVIPPVNNQYEMNKLETTITSNPIKNHESTLTNDVVGQISPPKTAEVSSTPTIPTIPERIASTHQEQVVSPVVQTNTTPSTVPKNASTQTWLVAIIIIILIVGTIIGTLFLK